MNSHPSLKIITFLCFVLFSFIINYSCSKDEELLRDAVLNKPTVILEEYLDGNSQIDSVLTTEVLIEEPVLSAEQDLANKVFELRTTIFPPTNDGYIQGNAGFDQNIVRLEEDRRVSYLMFDLSQIDTLGGSVDETNLEFTVEGDNGNGIISVFKGESNNWAEEALSIATAPKPDSLLGQLSADYEIGSTHTIELDTALVRPEVITLVMVQEEGNDLAFASKEHPNQKGPALKVTYSVPQDAEAIVFDDIMVSESETDSEIAEQESASEETTDETDIESGDEKEVEEQIEDSKSEDTANQEVELSEENDASESVTEDNGEEIEDGESEDAANQEEELSEENDASDSVTEANEEKAKEEEDVSDVLESGETTEEASEPENKDTSEEETPSDTTEIENDASIPEDENTEIENNNEPDAPQNEAPRAVAEADNTSGNIPLKVNFKGDGSSDDLGIEKYIWDFRDGSTATEANPVHTFEKTGTLEVRLTVTDAQGVSHTNSVTITITEDANKAPKAVAEASSQSGEAPLEIKFNAANSTDDGEIKAYRWNFKDGTTTGSENPSHTFEKAGSYDVELVVTDDQGLTDTTTTTITVAESVNEAPVAEASASPSSGFAPLEVNFKGDESNDDKNIDGYFWDFKDGSTSTSKNPSHTFSEPGTYEVILSVKDSEGQTNETTIIVQIEQRPTDNPENDDNANGGGEVIPENNDGDDNDDDDTIVSENNGNYPANAVFASSFGYNSSDATAAFQAAIKSGSSYVVIDKQSSDWIIQPSRFFDLRNMTIVFEPGVTLRAKSGAFREGARLFQLTRASNVTIEGSGATFRMNKSEYSAGEQRHALDINISSNITVSGLTFRDSGGDGVHIAGDGNGAYSQNITLEGIKSFNNVRNGLSIISAKDVWIRDSEFSNSSGKSPESGVTLESDRPTERLVNINFSGCKFNGNNSAGFLFSTAKMNSGSKPVSVNVVDSEFSNNMVAPKGARAEIFIGGGQTANPVSGEIRFERIKFNSSRNRIIFTRKASNGFQVLFKNCSATNVVTSSNSPIRLEAHISRNNLGGIKFENFDIQYNRNVPFMHINAPNTRGFQLQNVSGNFNITEPNDNPIKYSGGYKASSNSNVSINYNHN